jgi:cell division protein FtsB
MLAMFFGYNLKLGTRTAQLEKKNGKELKRIEELEKKNGREQREIDQLKAEIEKLKGGKHD